MASLAERDGSAGTASRPTTQQSKGRLVLEVEDFVLAHKAVVVRIYEVKSLGAVSSSPLNAVVSKGSDATEMDTDVNGASADEVVGFYITAVDEVGNEYSLSVSRQKAVYLHRVEQEARGFSSESVNEDTTSIDALAAGILAHLDIIGNRHRDIGKLAVREPQVHVVKKARVVPAKSSTAKQKNVHLPAKRQDQRAARSLKTAVKTREAIESAQRSGHVVSDITSTAASDDETLSPRTRKARKSSEYRLLNRMAVADAKTIWKSELESIHDDPSFRALMNGMDSDALAEQLGQKGSESTERVATLGAIKRVVPEKKTKHKELQQRRDKGREARLRITRATSSSAIHDLASASATAPANDAPSPRAATFEEIDGLPGNLVKRLPSLGNSSRRSLLSQSDSVRAPALAGSSYSRKSIVPEQPQEPEQFLRKRSDAAERRVLKDDSIFNEIPGMGIEITTERPVSRGSLLGSPRLDDAMHFEKLRMQENARRSSLVRDKDGNLRRRSSITRSPSRKQSLVATPELRDALATSVSAPELPRPDSAPVASELASPRQLATSPRFDVPVLAALSERVLQDDAIDSESTNLFQTTRKFVPDDDATRVVPEAPVSGASETECSDNDNNSSSEHGTPAPATEYQPPCELIADSADGASGTSGCSDPVEVNATPASTPQSHLLVEPSEQTIEVDEEESGQDGDGAEAQTQRSHDVDQDPAVRDTSAHEPALAPAAATVEKPSPPAVLELATTLPTPRQVCWVEESLEPAPLASPRLVRLPPVTAACEPRQDEGAVLAHELRQDHEATSIGSCEADAAQCAHSVIRTELLTSSSPAIDRVDLQEPPTPERSVLASEGQRAITDHDELQASVGVSLIDSTSDLSSRDEDNDHNQCKQLTPRPSGSEYSQTTCHAASSEEPTREPVASEIAAPTHSLSVHEESDVHRESIDPPLSSRDGSANGEALTSAPPRASESELDTQTATSQTAALSQTGSPPKPHKSKIHGALASDGSPRKSSSRSLLSQSTKGASPKRSKDQHNPEARRKSGLSAQKAEVDRATRKSSLKPSPRKLSSKDLGIHGDVDNRDDAKQGAGSVSAKVAKHHATHKKRSAESVAFLYTSPHYHKKWGRWLNRRLVVDKISCLQLEELVLENPQVEKHLVKLGLRYARWSGTSLAAILLLEHASLLPENSPRTHEYWNSLGNAHLDLFLRNRKFLPVSKYHLGKCLQAFTHAFAYMESMADPLLLLRYAICLFWRSGDANLEKADDVFRELFAKFASFCDKDRLNVTFLRFQTLARLHMYQEAAECIAAVVQLQAAAAAAAASTPPGSADSTASSTSSSVPGPYDTADYMMMLMHCQQCSGDYLVASATFSSVLKILGVTQEGSLSDEQYLELWYNLAEKCFAHEEYPLALEFYSIALSFAKDSHVLASIHYSRGLCCEAVGEDAKCVAEYKRARNVNRHIAPLVPLSDLHANYSEQFAAFLQKPIRQVIEEVRVNLYDKAVKKLQRIFRRKHKPQSGADDTKSSRGGAVLTRAPSFSNSDPRARRRNSLLRQPSSSVLGLGAGLPLQQEPMNEEDDEDDDRSTRDRAPEKIAHEQFLARQRVAVESIHQIRSDPRYHRSYTSQFALLTSSTSSSARTVAAKKVKSMPSESFAHTSGLLNPDRERPELRRKQSMEAFNKVVCLARHDVLSGRSD